MGWGSQQSKPGSAAAGTVREVATGRSCSTYIGTAAKAANTAPTVPAKPKFAILQLFIVQALFKSNFSHQY